MNQITASDKNGKKILARQGIELSDLWAAVAKDRPIIIVQGQSLDARSVSISGESEDILSESYQDYMDRMEKRYIAALLERTKNNVSEVARILGISPNTMYRKVKKLGL